MAQHPVRLSIEDDLSRSRLTVFFRLLLAIPHLVWVLLWSIAAFFAAIANWFATLVSGRPPAGLHEFLSRYVRYVTHVYAYLHLTANPFPSFAGRPGTYPVDVALPPPEPQPRAVTFFRLFLSIPALILASALLGGLSAPVSTGRRSGRYTSSGGGGGLAGVAAFLGWFASLARARMPRGLRDATAWGIGYRFVDAD